jgi:hypothetical protein
MKDLKQFRTKVLNKRKLQLEIKDLRSSYVKNPIDSVYKKLMEKTKILDSLE